MNKIKKFFSGLSFNLLATVVIALFIMAFIIASIAIQHFKSSLTETYDDLARLQAEACAERLDADLVYSFLEQYREDKDSHPEEKEEYKECVRFLQDFCDEKDLTFIYIFDAVSYKDYEIPYGHFDVVMEVVGKTYQKNEDNPDGFTPWELGYSKDASADNAELYKNVVESKKCVSLPRPNSPDDHGGPHVTVAYPLTNDKGEVKALLCTQVSMENLDVTQYRKLVTIAAVVFVAFDVTIAAVFLKRRFISPVVKITSEAQRFADENSPGENSVVSSVSTKLREINDLADAIDIMEKETLNYIERITVMTAENERIGTELNVARVIQAGALPSTFPPFPERNEFELFASMIPAKEVGGDFYDFYFIDDDHLALVIADVSGKGIPAALLMMVTKILVGDHALTGRDPAEILTFVNERIVKNNKADMFVTVWLGILEVSSGTVISSNAGHEEPVIISADGGVRFVKEKRNLVIGAMSGMKYRNNEIRLQPGDKLFIYTDGVPEANNSENQMFGLDGLEASIHSVKDRSPEEILKHIKADVDEFVGEAPQFDDQTMLCIEYCGQKGVEASFDAKLEKLSDVLGFIDSFLEDRGCPMKAQMQIDLAVEELFVNVANYAYPDRDGTAEITLSEENGVLTIQMSDEGVPFDPFKKPDPDISLGADERPIGGLGVFIVKKNMDSAEYRFENGKNILLMTKKIL